MLGNLKKKDQKYELEIGKVDQSKAQKDTFEIFKIYKTNGHLRKTKSYFHSLFKPKRIMVMTAKTDITRSQI
jgi:hypothetical protein